MAVSSVSFGNAQVFADLVNKPQSFTTQPSGATTITGEKKSHTGAKIGVGIAAAVIAAAVGLAIGANKGAFKFENWKNNKMVQDLYEKFKKPEKAKEIGKSVLEGMQTVGDTIGKYATEAFKKIQKLLPKAQKAANN